MFQFTDNLHDAKVQLPPYRSYLEVQLMKIGLNCSSLLSLFEGSSLFIPSSKKEVKFHDIASIFILQRSLIETYLTFFYLNFQSNNLDQSQFRFHLYELSGLNRRQQFPANGTEHQGKKTKEQIDIQKIEASIRANSYFNTLDLKKQNRLLSQKPAREFNSWVELIDQSPIGGNGEFKTLWRLYSNFAHSEMLGMIQLKSYFKNRSQQNQALFTTLKISCLIMANVIEHLKVNFKSIQIFCNGLPSKDCLLVELWVELAKKLKSS